MAEIVNLRRTRKQRARDDAAKEAQANRAKHGETKAVRQAREAERRLTERDLAGKRRED